jgi:hypothetical protein
MTVEPANNHQRSWFYNVGAPVPGINAAFGAIVGKPIAVRGPLPRETATTGGFLATSDFTGMNHVG